MIQKLKHRQSLQSQLCQHWGGTSRSHREGMPTSLLSFSIFLWLISMLACDDPNSDESSDQSTEQGSDNLPQVCDASRGLMPVREVLANPQDPCWTRIQSLYGRAIRIVLWSEGSASLWTRKTAYGTGLMTTAGHVKHACIDHDDKECHAALYDPKTVEGKAQIRLSNAEGIFADRWSAHFPFFQPQVRHTELSSSKVRPRYDFAVHVVDSQSFPAWGVTDFLEPKPVVDAPLSLHDPQGLTLAKQTWADPMVDTTVLTIGYPILNRLSLKREMHAVAGRVLSDAEAAEAIETLKSVEDEEGDIAYDAEVEFLFEGTSQKGMSGAGVFDEQGHQVGILVRGSLSRELGVQYLRAVRMRYVVESIHATLQTMPPEEAAAVMPYLEKP